MYGLSYELKTAVVPSDTSSKIVSYFGCISDQTQQIHVLCFVTRSLTKALLVNHLIFFPFTNLLQIGTEENMLNHHEQHILELNVHSSQLE